MLPMIPDTFIHIFAFLLGLVLVILTLFSAISTFVLPRSTRSKLNLLYFGALFRIFDLVSHIAKTFRRRDAIMAYYAPIGLMLLLPVWYTLIALGYTLMYWASGISSWMEAFRLSGSSMLTLGLSVPETFFVSILVFTEAMFGLIMVALLIAYLPTMYSAFSRREQAVNMLEVRAGTPPTAVEMLLRFHRIQGLDKLGDYWRTWELWFADIEESHSTLQMMVFFRSPRPELSWVTAAGAVLDSAALTLSAVDVPHEPSASLCIRAGFLALRRIASQFDIQFPDNPHHPADPISIRREEFDATLDRIAAGGVPLKPDRDRAWKDFAGWRVNYDTVLLALCELVMAPYAPWSSDRMPHRDHIMGGENS